MSSGGSFLYVSQVLNASGEAFRQDCALITGTVDDGDDLWSIGCEVEDSVWVDQPAANLLTAEETVGGVSQAEMGLVRNAVQYVEHFRA